MILFQDDLTKYQNDKEWYNLEYLCIHLECWKKHFNYYAKKNYKREDRKKEQIKRMDIAIRQINIIQYLIDTF